MSEGENSRVLVKSVGDVRAKESVRKFFVRYEPASLLPLLILGQESLLAVSCVQIKEWFFQQDNKRNDLIKELLVVGAAIMFISQLRLG